MEAINGKEYPLWGQFVDGQQHWIGGILEDLGDSMDRSMGVEPIQTCITGIEMTPNGSDSAMFTVKGDDFDCGFDVHHGGICAGEEGWITFSGYGDHKWRIKKPEK